MTDSTNWPPSPPALDLADNDVHVWLARLALPAPVLRRMEALLSADEREQAARFRFEKDRNHHVATRGILRSILGAYLSVEPAQLQFTGNSFGKPSLAHDSGPPLRFNLSHSHGLALYAITRAREVGIDLEFIRPDIATEPIAGKFFAPSEVAKLRGLAPDLQTSAFFDCWTRKEAYIKARGDGLSRRLNSFSVAFGPGEAPAVLHADDDPQASTRWSLLELVAPDGYAAALVVEGQGVRVHCWQWREEVSG
jgi:4'-phosphopantetheinyl transferase